MKNKTIREGGSRDSKSDLGQIYKQYKYLQESN